MIGTPDTAIVLIARAADFAARAHADQRRKGQAGEPYLNHLAEVAVLLAQATGGTDAELIVAGWLHDTLEDTAVSRHELEIQFGNRVCSIVAEVTDDKSLPKLERKRLQATSTPTKSEAARLIKLADKTSNLRSLVSSPPANWSPERLVEYVDWAATVIEGCRGLNAMLERQFDEALRLARAVLVAKA